MDNREVEIEDNNLFTSNPKNNFFLEQDSSFTQDTLQERTRRLNDYDCNLLKEEAYKDVSDELFKLEYKLSKLEDEYETLSTQIQAARDISDYDTVEYLMCRKQKIKDEIYVITKMYNAKSLSTKISGGVYSVLSFGLINYNERVKIFFKSIKEILLAILPRKISYIQGVKQSLLRLENINKSVDELMTLQTPYGESGDKYEQLSRYITRANAIQSKIAKTLR